MTAARAALATAAALVLAITPAVAHPPPLDIGGFTGGLLHPYFVPAHALAIVALGLLIGRQEVWGWLAAMAFALGLAAGLGVMTLGVVPSLMNEIVLGLALMVGLAVALARPLPEILGCVIAVLTGFCIALDSPPETISLSEANRMLIGTGVGALLLLLAVIAVASRLHAGWTGIGARIAGSWIAASALLVLALQLAR